MPYRVLHCLSSMNRGGAETFIMNVLRGIDRTKYRFFFVLNSDKGAYIDEIRSLGGVIYVIPSRSSGFMKYISNLDSFFKEHKGEFDAVHFHTSSLSSLEVLYYAKKHGVRNRIIHSHNTAQKGIVHNVLHWVNKPLCRVLANKYLACSKVAADWLYKYTNVHNKCVIINNGIDVELFKYKQENRFEIRNIHNIPSNSTIIGHVGRFDEVKNHIFLIKIFREFLNIQPDAYLVLVGIGPLKERCEKEAEILKIDNRIKFVGLQQEINKYLSAFDYFVFPSLYEGLPVALVEAQASGVTIICSDKVSSEAKLSDSLLFFPLKASEKEWAEYVNSLDFIDREIPPTQVIEKKYDRKSTIMYLTSYIYK